MDTAMKEQLYTIPVTDAFSEDTECPLCTMKKALETASVEYTMGPSYMEEDVRAKTDKEGFCRHHLDLMSQNQNRLGFALILSTHMDALIKDTEQLSKGARISPSFFKKAESSTLKSYTDKVKSSCFICGRMENTFERYLATIFYQYKQDKEFRKVFAGCKGFCIEHYGILYDMSLNSLKGSMLDEFQTTLNQVYLDNMKRVREDLEWFKDKFDYRYQDAPWKNSKDALPRTLTKVKGIL